jgi:AraC-like DNA-binding protein
VHRYLAREGHTFSGILESVRRDLAPGYVGDRSRPLSDVSALLGFATPSSFSRWYRRVFGGNPAADRRPGTLGSVSGLSGACRSMGSSRNDSGDLNLQRRVRSALRSCHPARDAG